MKRKMIIALIIILALAAALALAVFIVLQLPVFGGTPSGVRLERMEQSPHYRDGQFHNLTPTVMMTGQQKGGFASALWNFLLGKQPDNLRPSEPLEMVKQDLKHLPADKDIFVWFGHSSYLLSLHGTTFLVDPTLCTAAPFSFINKPFEGMDKYRPEDMPDHIDYLIISHDHYDHLDYQTVRHLKDRIGQVVCPLGVGAHFERWGFAPESLIELDWEEHSPLAEGFHIRCLPARHFSGRSLKRNNTLWASFLLQTPYGNLFLGGDSGYGEHFRQIGDKYPDIDLALLENGQYNEQWKFIHTMPAQLGKEAVELKARQVITVHHSKYALARHPWDEPLRNEQQARDRYGLNLRVVKPGEITCLTLRPTDVMSDRH